MKILYVSECYPSDEKPQYCIFLEQQAQALEELGNDVSVLVPASGEPCGTNSFKRNGITVYSMNFHMNFFQKSCVMKVVSRELRKFLQQQQYDIVAIQIVSMALQLEVVRASHLAGSKVVIHYHGLNIWQDYYPTHPIYERAILPVKQFHSKSVDAAICVSRSVEKVFRERNKKTPAFVVYNGVDLSRFAPNPIKFNSVFTVLCVANLIRIKGQEYLIEAIAELKKQGRDVWLQLIGDGADKQRLVNLVASLNLQNEVAFLGTMPYDTVAQYMSNADMFIMPSYYEALGCVYLESMASGTLTCGCNIYGPSELISHMKTGILVEPKSVSSIAEAIKFAMDNPDEIKRIVNDGVKAARLRTWKTSAEALNAAYHSILGKSLHILKSK